MTPSCGPDITSYSTFTPATRTLASLRGAGSLTPCLIAGDGAAGGAEGDEQPATAQRPVFGAGKVSAGWGLASVSDVAITIPALTATTASAAHPGSCACIQGGAKLSRRHGQARTPDASPCVEDGPAADDAAQSGYIKQLATSTSDIWNSFGHEPSLGQEVLPAARAEPSATVYDNPVTLFYAPDHGPSPRQSNPGGKGRHQGVIIASGENPPLPVTVAADCLGGVRERVRPCDWFIGDRFPMKLDQHAARRCDMSDVGDQAVADIDHRGRAERRRLRPGRVRRRWPSMRGNQCLQPGIRPGQSCAQQCQTRRRAAERPGHGDYVAWPGTAPGDWCGAGQIAECGDGEHDDVRAARVAACHRRASGGRLIADAADQVKDPADLEITWSGETHEQSSRTRSHGGDVCQISRCCFAANIAGRRPFPAEMPAFNEHVSRRDDATIGCADNGAVIADADNHVRIAGEHFGNGGDQSELTVFGDSDECLPSAFTQQASLLRFNPPPTVALRSHR